MSVDPELVQRARAWITGDPDPVTRSALTDLVTAALAGDPGAARDLESAVRTDLPFGTAGLRGPLGPGPNRMNRAVVIRAAAALARYLLDELPGGPEAASGETPLVVVGHDARHGSLTFAADTAAVLVAAGCRAMLLSRATPTPVVAAAVRRLDADAGVVVTASHNPAADNGFKVYLGGRMTDGPGRGVLIVPPADAAIADRIRVAAAAADTPRATCGWAVLGADEAVSDYCRDAVAALAPLLDAIPAGVRSGLVVAATAMHGVGAEVLDQLLARAGFAPAAWVTAQREPDPDFPTVPFPNPEVDGAMDAVTALAARRGASIAVALDPDADRCAVALPGLPPPAGSRDGSDTRSDTGSWSRLTGDQLGALLGEHLLAATAPPAPAPTTLAPSTRPPGGPGDAGAAEPAVASSVVSGTLLARIAAAHGVRHVTTLTGFKWISRTPGLVFGYEESIGYCAVPQVVRDKDGMTAAVVTLALAASLAARGRTVGDALDDLETRHGVHPSAQVTIRLDGDGDGDGGAHADGAGAILARLLATPPAALAGHPVVSVTDLSAGTSGLPATPGLRIEATEGVRLLVRPSGTEPILKAYLQVAGSPTAGPLNEARAAAQATLDTLRQEVIGLLG